MEDFVRNRFPGRFGPEVMLKEMVDAIEAAGPNDPLYGDFANLRAIHEYSRPNVHGGAPAPDPLQLRAQCKRIIKVIGSY